MYKGKISQESLIRALTNAITGENDLGEFMELTENDEKEIYSLANALSFNK